MKIAVLTSSRADYGIYLPLLKAMQQDPFFDLGLIVFGTHLSVLHGHTVDQVERDGFRIDYRVEHILASDSPDAIASSMAIAFTKFTSIWQREKDNYDLVLCLGDRYEMFAAVSAAVPYRIRFVHFHGGETTLGAIDNQFRHCITLFSSIHFAATAQYADRIAEIKGDMNDVHVSGSLSLANLVDMRLYSPEEFRERFNIDLSRPSILVTLHPETIAVEQNEANALELVKALEQLEDYQVIITMPNADTMGYAMRTVYEDAAARNPSIRLVENLGTQGYFSCMQLARLMVGNSSSGIIEAASFNKWVVDIGNRQKGRAVSGNIIHCEPVAAEILAACRAGLSKNEYRGENIYFQPNAVAGVISVLKR